MRNRSLLTVILTSLTAGCVTYTPITAPPVTVPSMRGTMKSDCPEPTPRPNPLPVPPPIADRVLVNIEPGKEPEADEGGYQLIYEYNAAQKAIKEFNEDLQQHPKEP